MNSARAADYREVVADAVRVASEGTLDCNESIRRIALCLKTGVQLRAAVDFLIDHPDGLVSGSSVTPPGVRALIANLRSAGFLQFTLPRCAKCSNERELRYKVDDGRICTPCYFRETARACHVCGRVKPVATVLPAGPICLSCRSKSEEKLEECMICGNRGQVAQRIGSDAICAKCYRSPPAECSRCGQITKIHSRKSGLALCGRCYEGPKRKCSRCGETATIASRGTSDNRGDLCSRCYEGAIQESCV